jgi:Caspase domain
MTRILWRRVAAVVLSCAAPAWAQESREMTFALGAQRALVLQVEYLDPAAFDTRLEGAQVWPVRVSVRNDSQQPQSFSALDLRLSVGGGEGLTPVSPVEIADEILARRTGPLSTFLRGQNTAFQPTALREQLRRSQLGSGTIAPRQTRQGIVLFRQPSSSPAADFNGVLQLDVAGYEPQLLATRAIDVQTKGKEQTFGERFTDLWNRYALGRQPPFNKSYALVIGVGRYDYLRSLDSPEKDVKKMADFLRGQGFDEVLTIRDRAVTQDLLQFPQKYLKAKMQPEDRFLFYYSGHGMSVPDGKGGATGYLPLSAEKPGGKGHSVPMTTLVSWLKQLSAKHLLVILDTCFSGLAIDGVELKNVSIFEGKVDGELLTWLTSGRARYLLMAGNESQEAIGGPRWNGSLFTDAVIKGLQEKADRNPDRLVTTRELHSWLERFVPQEARKVQHELTPLLKDLEPSVSRGEFVFLR